METLEKFLQTYFPVVEKVGEDEFLHRAIRNLKVDYLPELSYIAIASYLYYPRALHQYYIVNYAEPFLIVKYK